ncbi:MAG: VPS10 domain-containing protein, partial [Flavobacteriaceae bacterium]
FKMRNVGPAFLSGRIADIAVHPDNESVWYVAVGSGGVWKTTGGGQTWQPIFEQEATASVGALAIDQKNPSIIWVGTGEGNPRNSLNGGKGIYRSLDAGQSWELMGLEATRNIHRILIDPNDSNTVYVGAIGSPWGAHPERGVFKTTDGGKTWRHILKTNGHSGVADMVMDPSNPNKILVAMWEHFREPWFFKSGGSGSGLYITHDGGEHWTKKTEKEGLPQGDLGRIGLAISPSNPDRIYALIESKKNGLYVSLDGGSRWALVNDKNDIGNRPFYYSDIFVDPQNEYKLYSVFTYVNVSIDGGKNFEQLMPAYGVDNGVHPDHHAWWIHPTNGKFMLDGNDGGLNLTRDGGQSWRFMGNIPVGQFYHIAADMDVPYNVYGGMQDNGSWRGPAYVWKRQGIRNSYWQEISFGDGFDVVPDPTNSRFGWSMSQEGYVTRYDYLTGNNHLVRPTHPDPEVRLRFNWNSAINIDPVDPKTIYFGSQFVHKSEDKGLTWTIISDDLTTNDSEKQKQDESGGLTMDATGAENHTTILVIEPSPLNPAILWAGTDDGRVHLTQNGGNTWQSLEKNIKGLPSGSWITQIKASNKKPGTALLVANDYRRLNDGVYVYKTSNYGKTWQRIASDLDVGSFALSIVEDPVTDQLLFLGTDDGLYYSLNAGNTWTKWTHNFPTVPVSDLLIHPREHDLVIGTFGRSIWIMDDIRPLRALAMDASVVDQALVLFDPPEGYQAAYQQPTGSRFGADALFQGENRSSGITLSYWVNLDKISELKTQNTENQKDKETKDSLYLRIYKGEALIRSLQKPMPETQGIHHWTWYMDAKGSAWIRREPRKAKQEIGGGYLSPGTYQVSISIGQSDKSLLTSPKRSITVNADPRIAPIDPEAERLTQEMMAQVQSLSDEIIQMLEQIKKDKDGLDRLEKDLKRQKDSAYTDLTQSVSTMKKQLTELQDLFVGARDKRQGITADASPSVSDRMRLIMGYLRSRPNGPTQTEQQLLSQAKASAAEAKQSVLDFYSNDWVEFTQKVKSIDIPYFQTSEFQNDDQ